MTSQRCLEMALIALSRGDLDGAAGWCRAVIVALDRARTPPPRTLHDIAGTTAPSRFGQGCGRGRRTRGTDMATVTVRVTTADVRRGLPGDPLRCPVARALRRATGRRWAASRAVLRVEEEDGVIWARHLPAPPEAETFMRDYDHGREVRPFAFTLDVPDGWLAEE